jgi:tRNA (adenine22-N1)-methyltransferase
MTPLSARLETVLQLLHPCAVLADVGTDHGYVPVAAVQRGIAERALATDLRDAPLVGARRHIEHAGLSDRVTVVQGDGLLALADHPVDAVVMAGMSGHLMLRLGEAAPQVLATVQQLVLQPNTDVPLVRAWARRSGWHVREERMVQVRGRFFTLCAFGPGRGADPAYEVAGWSAPALELVGPLLLVRRDPVAHRWYEAQRRRLHALVAEGVHALAPELLDWQSACEFLR